MILPFETVAMYRSPFHSVDERFYTPQPPPPSQQPCLDLETRLCIQSISVAAHISILFFFFTPIYFKTILPF